MPARTRDGSVQWRLGSTALAAALAIPLSAAAAEDAPSPSAREPTPQIALRWKRLPGAEACIDEAVAALKAALAAAKGAATTLSVKVGLAVAIGSVSVATTVVHYAGDGPDDPAPSSRPHSSTQAPRSNGPAFTGSPPGHGAELDPATIDPPREEEEEASVGATEPSGPMPSPSAEAPRSIAGEEQTDAPPQRGAITTAPPEERRAPPSGTGAAPRLTPSSAPQLEARPPGAKEPSASEPPSSSEGIAAPAPSARAQRGRAPGGGPKARAKYPGAGALDGRGARAPVRGRDALSGARGHCD